MISSYAQAAGFNYLIGILLIGILLVSCAVPLLLTAGVFYKVHYQLSEDQLSGVVKCGSQLPVSRRFMKGIFAWAGCKCAYIDAYIDYIRQPHAAGKTKYNGWKLWNFAITSFSTAQSYIGLAIALEALLFATITLVFGAVTPGYASLMVSVLFLGGLQLISIGVLGEDVGRIYEDVGRIYMVKGRRPYLVRRVYSAANDAETAK